MNQFEFFCMVYFALDSQWQKSPNDELGNFLSSVNPFLFGHIGSADPAEFIEFCEFIKKESVPVEDSYGLAQTYIDFLDIPVVIAAFSQVTQAQWVQSTIQYLSQPHKGQQEP